MKRNILVGIFLTILIITSIFSIIKRTSKKDIKNNYNTYIENCKHNLESLNLSNQKEIDACKCSHDYLFNKYGESIYKEDFVVTNRIDSIALIECMLKTMGYDTINSEDVLNRIQNSTN